MLIARYDQIRLRSHGAGDDMVIIGIVGDYARYIVRCDYVRYAAQFTDDAQWHQPGLSQARGEFFARKHIKQLRQKYSAAAYLECLCSCSINQPTRRAACRDYAGDQRVGVEHNPHDQVRYVARFWRAA